MNNIVLVEEFFFFNCFPLVQTLSYFIYSNLHDIKEWFVMTATKGIYTLIVQISVKSRVGYLPQEANTVGQRLSF